MRSAMFIIIKRWFAYTYLCIRPLLKWFLRKITGLCEIQRICYENEKNAQRSRALESSLRRSRNQLIKTIIEQMDNCCQNRRLVGVNGHRLVEVAASGIIEAKRINRKIHGSKLQMPLTVCLAQIFGYCQLIQEVEHARSIPYSSDDLNHEEKLTKVVYLDQLWSSLMPDEPLKARVSKQWGTIGFQGNDPQTDFRGMGLLGLENLYYFATQYTGTARHVLSHSHHPKYGYSFAIVGINLTSMAYEFLASGALKTHMYNVIEGRPSFKHFHQVYVYLFYEFDKFWLKEKPNNIMEFSRIRNLFHQKITTILSKPNGLLRLNLFVEVI